VLGETGENYTLMSFYFPSRNQRQLKNKGKKENMTNPARVNEAIRARRPIGKYTITLRPRLKINADSSDSDYLQKTVGYDPRGPTEDADQLLEETRELPARWTREDTDKVLADIREEDEDGAQDARIEEAQYADVQGLADDDEEDAVADGGEDEGEAIEPDYDENQEEYLMEAF
jgi:hypothetical protein